MKNKTVRQVEFYDAGDQPHWRVHYKVTEDGSTYLHCHAFPPDTLTWRAAEYGIDPTDAAQLLQIVLHEPHMTGHDHRSPDHLYKTDQPTARQALLGRVKEAQTRVQIDDPDGHLDQIHKAHRPHPADLANKIAFVSHVRKHGHAPAPKIGLPDDG